MRKFYRIGILSTVLTIFIILYQLVNKFGINNSNTLSTSLEQKPLSESAKAEKCLKYFENLHKFNNEWSHDGIRVFHNYDKIDNNILKDTMEHLRVYSYCYFNNDLPLLLNPTEDNTIDDLEFRLFPFLNHDLFDKTTLKKKIGLKIYDVRAKTYTSLNTKGGFAVNAFQRGKESFWRYWINQVSSSSADQFSKENEKEGENKEEGEKADNSILYTGGRGIVMTIAPDHIQLMLKLIHMLDFWGNELPIQIIFKDLTGEFHPSMIDYMEVLIRDKTKQQVYFIDAYEYLNPAYLEDDITYFANKWLALIFNTFEEIIFMDADVVPFVDPVELFDLQEYKQTGAVLFKDRKMDNERTFKYCIDMFEWMEPSKTETKEWLHEKLFDKKKKKGQKHNEAMQNSELYNIYEDFFTKKHLHHIDSGLMVINKRKKLNVLLTSFMLNLSAKVIRCVYGDKEMYWLGSLFQLDYNVSIIPMNGAVIGKGKLLDDKKSVQVCGTQLAHVYPQQSGSNKYKLLWTNGGLKKCKLNKKLAAEQDFKDYPDYFKEKYKITNSAELSFIYDSALFMDTISIPDVQEHPWVHLKDCCGYMYCSVTTPKNADENENDNVNKGLTLKLDNDDILFYDKLIYEWDTF